jgi:hypothetical protein
MTSALCATRSQSISPRQETRRFPAHRADPDRVMQAGGQPISWVSLSCEQQCGWALQGTAAVIVEIVLTGRQLKEL